MIKLMNALLKVSAVYSGSLMAQSLERQTYIGANGQPIGSSTTFQGHSTYFNGQGQYIGESTSSKTAPIGGSDYGRAPSPNESYQMPNLNYKGSSTYGDYLFEQLIFSK